MERFKDGSGELIEADLDFHMGILGATDNPFLTALGGLIHASLQCAFRYSWEGAARIHDSRLLQHGAILEAIRAGEPERGARAHARTVVGFAGGRPRVLEPPQGADETLGYFA